MYFRISFNIIHWHWGNHMIVPVPVKEPWRIWVNFSWTKPKRLAAWKECRITGGDVAIPVCWLQCMVFVNGRKYPSAARCWRPGSRLNIKTIFPRYGIPMSKIRRSRDRLIFNMGIPILIRHHLYNEMAPLQTDILSAFCLNFENNLFNIISSIFLMINLIIHPCIIYLRCVLK